MGFFSFLSFLSSGSLIHVPHLSVALLILLENVLSCTAEGEASLIHTEDEKDLFSIVMTSLSYRDWNYEFDPSFDV